jgi:hypothetical protein
MAYIGVFHTFIAVKLKEKFNNEFSNIIKRSEIKKLLCLYHVPIDLHQKFLEEMQQFKLVKLKNKQNIELCIDKIKGYNIDSDIIKMRDEGKKQQEIAKEFGVNQSVISRRLNKR